MVAGLGLGVFGAALATLIAQGIFDSPMEVNMLERMLYINRNGKPTK